MATGCTGDLEDRFSEDGVQLRESLSNGILLNGILVNGILLNGILVNGPTAVDWSFSGQAVNFILKQSNGKIKLKYDGGGGTTNFGSGDVITVEVVVDNQDYKIKFSDYENVSGAPYHFQTIEVAPWEGSDWGSFTSACGNPNDRAVVVSGYWDNSGVWVDDSDVVSFACESGDAVGKAVVLGYHPEDTYGNVSLRPYHQAAIRAIRADYCYNSTSYTQNGMVIDLYDTLGVVSQDSTYPIEAVWGETQALCVGVPRHSSHPRSSIPCSVPNCDTQTDEYWESHPDALVITRTAPGT